MDVSEHSQRMYTDKTNGVEAGEKPHTLGKADKIGLKKCSDRSMEV